MIHVRMLLGLAGVLLADMASDMNDQITTIALPDICGALSIGIDAGTRIDRLHLSAQPLGMAISAWFVVTLTSRRWAITVIAFNAVTSTLLPFCPNVEAFSTLRPRRAWPEACRRRHRLSGSSSLRN